MKGWRLQTPQSGASAGTPGISCGSAWTKTTTAPRPARSSRATSRTNVPLSGWVQRLFLVSGRQGGSPFLCPRLRPDRWGTSARGGTSWSTRRGFRPKASPPLKVLGRSPNASRWGGGGQRESRLSVFSCCFHGNSDGSRQRSVEGTRSAFRPQKTPNSLGIKRSSRRVGLFLLLKSSSLWIRT